MAQDQASPSGPDLSQGVDLVAIPDRGMLLGHVGEEEVLLVRHGAIVFAVAAHCTHYHGPLAEGLVVGETVRCPWHHACFDLATGEALAAPALTPLTCWHVEQRDGKVFVAEKKAQPKPRGKSPARTPQNVVIIGGGAAAFAAAEMLRRRDYQGPIIMVSSEEVPPVDRPNLSKDYLAGTAPEEWVPLRPDSFYSENGIELRLATAVGAIDVRNRTITFGNGSAIGFDRLLLATGAEPLRLAIPGANLPHVHTLRSLADCRAIIATAKTARRAVVLGASFIGLEVAASLRARDIDVHVVAPEQRPMERILGPDLGNFIRALHEQHGVVFHLGSTASAIEPGRVQLADGTTLATDLVVLGVGVRPRTALAEQAGLALDRGVTVNEYLETNAPGIFAAGDIARWPDPHTGNNIRVEHWVVAERQGQTAALNMLGLRRKHTAIPFFWSQHYDVPINYVGHAEQWDEIAIEGDIAAKDCLLRYKRAGRVLAVASIFRDVANLEAELAMERATG
jgi:NADPH-dependent 2,4-dienoyl-CoA reductase/sulfur reductase-like enzyme/nitrite reductase/ring-hydroxylating ferredoxin subunit